MSLVAIFVVLVVFLLVLYLVNSLIPMDPRARTVLNVVVVLAMCLWLLDLVGVLPGGPYVGYTRRH
jgi:hypothetical protein